jgi:hypothetical protein
LLSSLSTTSAALKNILRGTRGAIRFLAICADFQCRETTRLRATAGSDIEIFTSSKGVVTCSLSRRPPCSFLPNFHGTHGLDNRLICYRTDFAILQRSAVHPPARKDASPLADACGTTLDDRSYRLVVPLERTDAHFSSDERLFDDIQDVLYPLHTPQFLRLPPYSWKLPFNPTVSAARHLALKVDSCLAPSTCLQQFSIVPKCLNIRISRWIDP